MSWKAFLGITAIGEGLTGLALLALPAVPLALLLGLRATAPETRLVARVAGASLMAIGVISGAAINADGEGALSAVLFGILVYDTLVAGVLAAAGATLGLVGVLLWPAVATHVALALCGAACLRAVRAAANGATRIR